MNANVFAVFYFCVWTALMKVLGDLLSPGITSAFISASRLLLSAIIAYFFYPVFKRNVFNRKIQPHDKAVFITGCDTGFGHELAKRLDSKGFHVFASCLNPSGDGAERLKRRPSGRLRVLGLDVSKEESVKEAVDYVKANLGESQLWAVVNNAGILQVCDVPLCPVDDYKECLEVNTLGVIRVTKAFLPMLLRSRGRVVTITSIASRLTCLHISAYCMSKFATRAFCESLRQEMEQRGVKIIEIEPEGYKTSLTSGRILESKFEKTIARASDEEKSIFGKNYFSSFRKALRNSTSVCSGKLYKVMDSLEDAVSLAKPDEVYKAHRDTVTSLIIFIADNLPGPLLDVIMRIGMWALEILLPMSTEYSWSLLRSMLNSLCNKPHLRIYFSDGIKL